ncbi:hypothetical protein [Pyxidicoccus fallax]|nr:hypothetical protein [Pyxidicoccus fallax]
MKLSFGVGGGAVLAAALVLGSGCASRQQVDSAPRARVTGDVSQYYPLAVGNRWTYRVNGQEREQPEAIEILKEEDGYFHDNRGGQLTVDAYGLRDPKRYLLRAPVEVGNSWTNVVSVSSTERYRILEVGVRCEAPAGTFDNCVRVEGRNRINADTTLVNTQTFAPGVGLVRIHVDLETKGQRVPQMWLELTSWKVRPQVSSSEG